MQQLHDPPPLVRQSASDPLTALVQRHQTAVWRFLRSLGCSAADAEELAVEVFVVAHEKQLAARQDGELAARRFLQATARNLWLRRRRAAHRDAQRLSVAAQALWDRHCRRDGGDGWLDLLRECLAQLDGRAATAIQRVHGEGCSRADVASELGLKVNGVKTLLLRTKRVLRACMERRSS